MASLADRKDSQSIHATWGESVSYVRRGEVIASSLSAVPKKVDYDVDDSYGIPQKVNFYNLNFITANMISDDEDRIEASPGDQIKITIDDWEYTYEVAPPGKRPVAEWEDSSGVVTTVHTKLVSKCPTS